jgi:hypothetical protein
MATAMVGSGRDDYGFVETYGVGNCYGDDDNEDSGDGNDDDYDDDGNDEDNDDDDDNNGDGLLLLCLIPNFVKCLGKVAAEKHNRSTVFTLASCMDDSCVMAFHAG